MSYSYKCYSDTKDIMKKYVNAVEGAAIYGLGKTRIMTLAKEAGAVYKVGNSALINTEIFESYSEFQDKYDSLKADEKRLDRLFEKTCYAKEIDEMAAALVESFISHLSSRDDLEKAAVTVAEGIKDYSTGKRGR